MCVGPLGRVARQDEQGGIQLRPRGEEKIRRGSIFCCRLGKANRARSLSLFRLVPPGEFLSDSETALDEPRRSSGRRSAPCSKEEKEETSGQNRNART